MKAIASPQLENGYTRIANELLNALARVDINGTQAAILFAVIRETYGFGRKSAALGTSMIAEMTGRHRTRVALELQRLIARGILTEVSPASFGTCRSLSLNKNYHAWAAALSTETLTASESATGSENVEETVNESVDETVNGSVDPNTIKKPFKETIKDMGEQKPKKARTFTPPSVSDCRAYAETIGIHPGEGDAFYDHFEARGWRFKSGDMMRDWNAALRTWKRNGAKYNGTANMQRLGA